MKIYKLHYNNVVTQEIETDYFTSLPKLLESLFGQNYNLEMGQQAKLNSGHVKDCVKRGGGIRFEYKNFQKDYIKAEITSINVK